MKNQTYNEEQKKGKFTMEKTVVEKFTEKNLTLIEAVNLIKSFDKAGWMFWLDVLAVSDSMKGRIMKELNLLDYGQTI